MYDINKRRFGLIGEKIAQRYLKENGYNIIFTNYYTKRGEIDIIATYKNKLVFFEVKTRTNKKYGVPSEAVNYLKKQHIKRCAAIFLSRNNFCKYIVRFDVIEVMIMNGKCKINHIKQII